ncbi:hypothetical protein [Nitrobacter sp. TKz-YC02]|uniref:thiolase family protein n=1 Tax=Nitrobacter sp. TKz-YC02 TaxID=3398704 RepID=UPI003CE783B0
MLQALVCNALRTPIGRYGGALSSVRADDLAAVPLRGLMARNPNVGWSAVDDLICIGVGQGITNIVERV